MAAFPNVETEGGICHLAVDGDLHTGGESPNNFLESQKVPIGGYDWTIRCRLVNWHNGGGSKSRIELFVGCVLAQAKGGRGGDVVATYSMRLFSSRPSKTEILNPRKSTGIPMLESGDTHVFRPGDYHGGPFMNRDELQAAGISSNGRLMVACTVQVHVCPGMSVPPSTLCQNLRNLFESRNQGADVTFSICGEVFRAHRCILAARAPGFEKEVIGDADPNALDVRVSIGDMEPLEFKAMLLFIYTDVLPEMVELTGDGSKEVSVRIAQRLLVVADRYGMTRMLDCCQARLCRDISVNTAASTLALAELHQLHQLRDFCCKYIVSDGRFPIVMKTDGYKLLTSSFPSIRDDLLIELTKMANNHHHLLS